MRTYERAYNERDKTDSGAHAAEYIRNFLEGESIPGIENEYRYVQELLPGITLDEINAYARRTIPADSGKLVVYTGPAKQDAAVPPASSCWPPSPPPSASRSRPTTRRRWRRA
jgi:zinc protease